MLTLIFLENLNLFINLVRYQLLDLIYVPLEFHHNTSSESKYLECMTILIIFIIQIEEMDKFIHIISITLSTTNPSRI